VSELLHRKSQMNFWPRWWQLLSWNLIEKSNYAAYNKREIDCLKLKGFPSRFASCGLFALVNSASDAACCRDFLSWSRLMQERSVFLPMWATLKGDKCEITSSFSTPLSVCFESHFILAVVACWMFSAHHICILWPRKSFIPILKLVEVLEQIVRDIYLV